MISPITLPPKVLLVHDQSCGNDEDVCKVRSLVRNLETCSMQVVNALDQHEAMILLDGGIRAAMIDWNLQPCSEHRAAQNVLANIRQRELNIPVFLFVNNGNADGISANVLAQVDGFIWLDDEKTDDIVADLVSAMERYRLVFLHPVLTMEVDAGARAENVRIAPELSGYAILGFGSQKTSFVRL